MRRSTLAAIGTLVLTLAVAATASAATKSSSGASGTAKGKPIIIGAAIDKTNFMSFFNLPALTAAKLEIAKINAGGGVLNGRPLAFKDEDTTLDPAKTKSAALDLLGKSADIGWVTCDVDYAAPAVQEFLQRKKLTIAPCIGTDQMGPKRFASAGKLAFSFGNVAQDEGAALAKLAIKKKWKTAVVVEDQLLYYTKSVCESFISRYKQLGGNVVSTIKFTQNDKTIGNVTNEVNRTKAQTIAICTVTQSDLPSFVSGLRGLNDNRPIISPWSADGTFWLPKSPKVSNFWVITFASIYGDDPSKQVRSLISKMKGKAKPTTGAFVTGASAIDAIAYAIKKTKSTNGAKLAGALQKLHNFPTSGGPISFSSKFHTVFGRQYRIIRVTNGTAKYQGLIRAGTPANIG
ncbi:MAG: branched-chain amino acid transport system substrate-binding protein [Gaiellaceae bacterium]|nr:branched-chain amino acid transport system substrate-binding protein [Gaiellaceae bacterium]